MQFSLNIMYPCSVTSFCFFFRVVTLILCQPKVNVSVVFFIFTLKLGEDVQFEEHIFQMGWFNHQPVIVQDIFSIDPDLQPFNTLEFDQDVGTQFTMWS